MCRLILCALQCTSRFLGFSLDATLGLAALAKDWCHASKVSGSLYVTILSPALPSLQKARKCRVPAVTKAAGKMAVGVTHGLEAGQAGEVRALAGLAAGAERALAGPRKEKIGRAVLAKVEANASRT